MFYYLSLTQSFLMDMYRSVDSGQTWPTRAPAYGGDKNWMAIDRTAGIGAGNIYCSWQTSSNPFAPATFTRSEGGGVAFDGPFALPTTSNYGTIAVGPDGAVYQIGSVFGTSTFNMVRSADIKNPGSWPTFTSRSVGMSGSLVFSEPPNPEGLAGQPWIAVNHAPGSLNGQVYVLCSVRPSGADPMDVHFVRSTNGGDSWSTPIRINDDPAGAGNVQWFGTMSVAPNGRIDAVWIDTRDTGDAFIGRLYYSYSTNGGLNWSPNEPITPLFDSSLGWPQQNKMGDYYDMESDNAGANLAYAATFNGEEDVYYLRIGLYDCNNNAIDDSQDIGGGTSPDCNANQVPDECETGGAIDCNLNQVPDLCDLNSGTSSDCNRNQIPDECDLLSGASHDCNNNAIPDDCEFRGSVDCNGNGSSDLCDIVSGASADCSGNGIPDECEADCNNNGIVDSCEVFNGQALDCNNNGVPDACDISNVAYSFSLSSDPGWTRQGQWGFGQPSGGGTTGRRDPTSGFTGPNVFGYNLAGLYANGMTISEYLTTKPLDLTGRTGIQVVFRRWLGVQSYTSDKAFIEVTRDDVDWGTVWVNGSSTISESAWSLQTYNLGSIAENQPYVRIRWGMGPTNASQQYQGWNIDDIEIRSTARSRDCNINGIPDECDIAGGVAPDCNGNGIIDACDIGATENDCNGNGVPDRCDVLAGLDDDCDNNGLLNSCEIAAGAPDCDNDGVPDSCEINGVNGDCNNNDILDDCEVVGGTQSDCNQNGLLDSCEVDSLIAFDCDGNGVLDVCDIASGAGEDCNANGKLDSCDLVGATLVEYSGVYSPFGFGVNPSFTLNPAPDATGPVLFRFTARGDLSAADEWVSIEVNGVAVGTAYDQGAFVDCIDGQVDDVVVPAAAYNAAKNGSLAVIALVASPSVNPAPDCFNPPKISFRISYARGPLSSDANGNGVPDECDAPAGCVGDMDCDGDVDFFDIDPLVLAFSGEATYLATFPNCRWLNGDADGDGDVDFFDIDPFIARLGAPCP